MAVPRARLEQLEQRAVEADRLAVELQAPRSEINRLKGLQEANRISVNGRSDSSISQGIPSSRETPPNAPPGSTASAAGRSIKTLPGPPLESVAPLQPGVTVLLTDLLLHYATSPEAADRRYRRQVVRVRGVITGVSKELLASTYSLAFRLPDQAVRLLCNFTPLAEYTRVYVDTTQERVMAGSDRAKPRPLAQTGMEVVCAGRCAGMRNGVLVFNNCALVP